MELIKGFCVLLLCQFLGEVIGRALVLPVPGPVLGMLLLLMGLMLRGRLRKRIVPAADREGEAVRRDGDMGQRQLARALLRERVPGSLRLASNGLLAHLSLLFVPAGVGVMVHFGLIARDLMPIVITLVVSIAVTQLVTAWLLQRLIDRRPPAALQTPQRNEVSS
ncbi:CidA/LrgA family protein [Cobetia crustatorum]|uniref:CidA/LrgA family protein n=1 Tax=Cobetia crustatorum TaxID=553385 RepID=A0A558HEA1_9GAMM|nr:CidA/LrgA family protein [Cobetia crustatorum]TVU67473.1 CidA/LrgA family protein [Cobetia crustatorum]